MTPAMTPETGDVECMYCACMPHIQIRNVPDDVHAELVSRAEWRGVSLQQFLLDQLIRLTSRADIDQVFDRLDKMNHEYNISMEDTVAAIRADRDSR